MDDSEDVALSGLSGRFPDCESVEEFAQKLLDGVDLVSDDGRRWSPGLHGLPERSGKLKALSHFDAAFFGVHSKQAHVMDPQLRLLLECTYEAIVDAGYNPAELRGSRTGVFVGVSYSESEEKWNENPDKITGYALTGCCRGMFANRISYTFDFKGPSYAVDTACSSSMCAFAQAVAAMRAGQCTAAIIAGTNLCLNPNSSLNFHRLRMLSPEGRCASFDAAASGYVRSEAVVVTLLQLRGATRRLYATVRGASLGVDGFKARGITYPSGDMQRRLALETLEEAHLRPRDVVYVEAHGTGTRVGDPLEANAIAELFCEDRDTPLLMGTVKSNIGHSEAASGLCSIAKVVVAMERGVIPGNLHYNVPNPKIPALSDGRIQVVSRNTEWSGGLVVVNSFGFGGANALALLQSHECERPSPAAVNTPRLILASGRTDIAVHELLEHANANSDDAELHALLHAVHARDIPGHVRRGYRLLVEPPMQEIIECKTSVQRRQLWFLFTGAGSHWPGMGRALLVLPAFAQSVARSAATLKPLGFDLMHALTELQQFDVVSALVSLTAVQVALMDLLRDLDLHPDGISGQSVGEIACAYADGALTAEQAILCAYWRARSVADSRVPPGAMAVVGLSAEECLARCPPDVDIACYHTEAHVSVAGPEESVDRFVLELQAEGVFARKFDSLGKAFHSRYIESAAPLLLESHSRIIPNPKRRSERWISSAVPEDECDTNEARLCDAAYFVRNLVDPVRFATALHAVPPRAVVLEVAPHAQLAGMLRRALPRAEHVALVRRDSADAAQHLLAAIGKLYNAGFQPQISRLYPPVPWPVSRGTPGLASHVRWDHSEEWSVARFDHAARGSEHVYEYDLSKSDDAFLADHNIDGRVLFPATAYLTLVWRSIAKQNNRKLEETPVVFENVQFKCATILPREGIVSFSVNIFNGSGNFELCEGDNVVATGTVCIPADPDTERLPPSNFSSTRPDHNELLQLTPEDIYKELKLRGYNYGHTFRGIKSSNAQVTSGVLEWNDNWITFMDTMLQFDIISSDTRELYLPTRMQRISIDPLSHLATSRSTEGMIPVYRNSNIGLIAAGGVELRNLKTNLAQRRNNLQALPKLEQHVFVPYDNLGALSSDPLEAKSIAIKVNLQILLENAGIEKIKIIEVTSGRSPISLLLPLVLSILDMEPFVRVVGSSLAVENNSDVYLNEVKDQDIQVMDTNAVLGVTNGASFHVILAVDAASLRRLSELTTALADMGMILLEEPRGTIDESEVKEMIKNAGLSVVSRQVAADKEYVLLRRLPEAARTKYAVVDITSDISYAWVDELKQAMRRAETKDIEAVYAVSSDQNSGILGLGTCLHNELGTSLLRIFYLQNVQKEFSPKADGFQAQVQKDLVVNVLLGEMWGSYRHLPVARRNDDELKVEQAYVNTMTRGDLSSLCWIESPLRWAADKTDYPSTNLCRVYYAALNFRDVMLATGQLPPDALPGSLAGQECILGLEFSGRSSSNKRVMGMVEARGLATSVRADEGFLWEVPEDWTLQQAASVPVAYATAYYALMVRGRMRRGEAVLVHAGAGGVGQAAITLALHAGCTVFTTVGTQEKRAFLLSQFPALPDAYIGNSRDTSFEQLVLERTGGRGVDLVLNSLARDKLHASLRCLARGGRFLEIGKLDLSNDSPLGLSVLLKNTTVHGLLLDALFDDAGGYEDEKACVVRCVTEGIASGAVRPLPVTVFADQELEPAFRYMSTGKHIGKVVIQIREEEPSSLSKPNCCKPSDRLFSAIPRTYFHPSKSYVLVGGLGGFGLELCHWMITRGARKLVLTSRSGVRTGYQALRIRRWRASGVLIEMSTEDVCIEAGARALLRAAAAHGPVGGVFNLAAVLDNGLHEHLTRTQFRTVARPKIDGTIALDAATRELTPELDHFVVWSSIASGRGGAGQCNYGLANSAMERLVEQRQANGLPGLAIQWGAIGDVGMVIDFGGKEDLVLIGTEQQRVSSCLQELDTMLARPTPPVLACCVLADKRPAADAAAARAQLAEQVAQIIGVRESAVPAGATLAQLGMDSLVGAEVRQLLARRDVTLGLREVRALTFERLRALAAAK